MAATMLHPRLRAAFAELFARDRVDVSPYVIYGPSDLARIRRPPLRKSRARWRASCACPPVPFFIASRNPSTPCDQPPKVSTPKTLQPSTSFNPSSTMPKASRPSTGSPSLSSSSMSAPGRSKNTPTTVSSVRPPRPSQRRKFDPVDPSYLTIVQAIHEHTLSLSPADRLEFAMCLRLELIDVVLGVGAIVTRGLAAPRKA